MIRRLLALADDRRAVAHYVVLLVLSGLARTGTVLALVPLLSALFGAEPSRALPWLGLLAALTVLGWIADKRLHRAGFDIGFALLHTVEGRILDRLERVPADRLDARIRADAQRALTSAGQEICQGIGYLVTPAANALITPLLIGAGLLLVAWPLGIAAIAAVPVLLGAMALSGMLLRASDEAYARASDDVGTRIVELAQHQPALRAAGQADGGDSALGTALDRQRHAALRLLGFGIPGTVVFSVAAQLSLLALAGIAVWLYLSGTLTAAALVALVVVAVRFLEPFNTLGDLSPAVQALRGTLDRLHGVLATPELARIPSAATDPTAPVLAFHDVAFAYRDGDGFALDGITFDVPAGTTTAIVGPSGSGKSTLLALAAHLHDPVRGTVLLQGVDVRAYEPADLAARYAVVHQNVYLFDGTLRDNVLLGRPTATPEELAEAASRAGLDETLARLPDGWNTRVGESGAALSGGERQRVSIARALLKDAPLLLLDEATSALDNGNERDIVAALADSAPGRATVIVAHRLNTVMGADLVLFLEDGRIVEEGSPEELIAAGGRFAEYRRQREEAAGWHLVEG